MTEPGSDPELDAVWSAFGRAYGLQPQGLGQLVAMIRQTARLAAREEVRVQRISDEKAEQLVAEVRAAAAAACAESARRNGCDPAHGARVAPNHSPVTES